MKTLISILIVSLLSILAFAMDAQEIEEKSMELLTLAQESEPFKMYGADQLNLKIAMASIIENKTVNIADIKAKYESLKEKIKTETVEFETFADFEAREKTIWPASGDVLTDIQRIQDVGITVIEPVFKNPADTEVWEKNKKSQAEFMQKAGLAGLATAMTLSTQSAEENEKLKSELSKFTQSFDRYEGRLQSSFKEMFASEGEGFLKNAFPILMSEYLENVNNRTKTNILANMLEGQFPFTKDSLVMSLFTNAGPQLQKMVQTLARNKSLEPKWQALFQTFESGVRPVPFWQVEELLARAKFPFKIVRINPEPLGVGTVAQTHLGIIEKPDGSLEELVFRFIKPGMKERSLEEADVLKNACEVIDAHPDIVGKNYPRLASIADNAYKMIIQDMILAESAKNQTLGRKVYQRKDVTVPEVWLSMDDEQLFMYQTKAEGKKISKYSLDIQKKVLKRVVEVWLEEALFGSGFFHADLHQGNSMADVDGKKNLKSFIDFGMIGKLTPKDRVNLLGLGIAVKLNDPKVLTDIAWKLSELKENKITKEQLKERIQQRLIQLNGASFSISELLKFFSEAGLELNHNVLSFLRGSITLGDQIVEVDPKMGLLDVAAKIALKHPLKVLKVLGLKEIKFKDLVRITWSQYISPIFTKNKIPPAMRQCVGFYK